VFEFSNWFDYTSFGGVSIQLLQHRRDNGRRNYCTYLAYDTLPGGGFDVGHLCACRVHDTPNSIGFQLN
jgi:hypothetical protein